MFHTGTILRDINTRKPSTATRKLMNISGQQPSIRTGGEENNEARL